MERVITPMQRITSRQVEGMREFSSSQDCCYLKTMNTRLMETCEPSQEKLKAAVNFLTLLYPDFTLRSQYPVLQSKVGSWFLFSQWDLTCWFLSSSDEGAWTHYSCSAPEESEFHSVIKYYPQPS